MRWCSTRPPTKTRHPGQPQRQGRTSQHAHFSTFLSCLPPLLLHLLQAHSIAVYPLTMPSRQLTRRPGTGGGRRGGTRDPQPMAS
eukprot:1274220-Pyramimonas_sp.AAC.2